MTECRADVFRKEYKALDENQISMMNAIKDQAEILYRCIDVAGVPVDVRAMALAKTNLEQAVMWAIKAIT